MVQIDIPFTFGVGSLFAAAAEQGLRGPQSKYFYYRALAVDLLFQITLIVWFPLYFLVNQFGMQTSHMWWTKDELTDYPWLLPAFFVAYFVANISGYHLGVRFVRQGRTAWVWAMFWASMTVSTLWVGLQPYRTLSLGTYEEWRAGTAQWLSTDRPLLIAVFADMAVFSVMLVVLFRMLKREAAAAAQPSITNHSRRSG
jgi:hypothetical protein